jgi:hypothetical protein
MWQISEVYFVVVGVILLFGILTIPFSVKKRPTFPDSVATITKAAKGTIPVEAATAITDVRAQQAAMGESYSSGQKIAPIPERTTV